MPKQIVPVGEWSPDLPSFSNPGTGVALNCLPQTQLSYGPLKELKALGTSTIMGQVFGMFYFMDKLLGNHVFVGTANRLYHQFTHDSGFVDVTNPLTTNYNSSSDDVWHFTSYGEAVMATNGTDKVQIMTIGDTEFSDLDIPRAKYMATVRDFLVLAFVTEAADSQTYPQRVHWSAIGDASNFPELATLDAAELLSDAQDLRSDLGVIQGIAANLQSSDMAIFLDNAVYSGSFVGSPAVFSFQIAQGATGTRAPDSIISSRGYAYYWGLDGIYSFDGTAPTNIGGQKVDSFIFSDGFDGLNPASATTVQGAADPTGKFVLWAYASRNSLNGIPDRILIYNWSIQRFALARIGVEWLAKSASQGYTLDELDQFGNLDDLPLSLDDPAWNGGFPGLYCIDLSNNLASFGGPNLEATIETTELMPNQEGRARTTNTRPLVDGGTPTIALATRNRLEDPLVYGPAVPMNVYGECPQRVDSIFVKAKITIPYGALWSHCQGIQLEASPSTRR